MKRISILITWVLVCLCVIGISCAVAGGHKLIIPEGTRTIEEEAFFKTSALYEVVLPEGITRIEKRAFMGSSVKVINFPSSLVYIAEDAFDQKKLKITVEEGTYAYDWAVAHKYISEYEDWDISVPEEPEEDIYEVFDYSVEPGGVHIHEYTGHKSTVIIPAEFDGIPVVSVCLNKSDGERKHGITKVVLPSQPVELGSYAFYNLSELNTIEGLEYVTSLANYVFFDTSVTEAVFSSSLRQMASGSVAASILARLTIPSDVEFEAGAFYNFNLKRITLTEGQGEKTLMLKDGVLFSADGKTLLCYPSGKKGSVYTVPDGTEILGEYAFNSRYLSELTIPRSVIATEPAFLQVHATTDIRVYKDSYAHQAVQQLADQTSLIRCVVIEEEQETLRQIIERIVRENAPSGSDYDKALALHDWLISHAEYDYRDSGIAYSSGSDMLRYGMGVCNGYAEAYALLLDEAGIENTTAGNSIHIFNAVKADGSWMYVDCTWDDMESDAYTNHRYFGFEDTIRYRVYGGDDPDTLDDIIIESESFTVKDYSKHYWYKNGYCKGAIQDAKKLVTNSLEQGKRNGEVPLIGDEVLNLLTAAALGDMKWDVDGEDIKLSFGWANDVLYFHIASDSDEDISDFEYDIKNNKVRILKYTGSDPIVVIPSRINGIPVTCIGPAFYGNYTVRSVLLPKSVTEIEANAFRNAVCLQKINFPEKLAIIGDNAFNTCVSLASDIILPDGCSELGFAAFVNCYSIKKVRLPGTIRMSDLAFLDCRGIESLVLEEGITSLSNSAFSGCRNLSEVVLPDSLEFMGGNVFYQTGLTRLNIPANVSYIGLSPVQECSKLVSLTVDPNSKFFKASDNIVFSADGKTILFSAMNAGTANYTVPDSVTKLNDRAFYANTTIKNLVIPGHVKTIRYEALADMSVLESVRIEEGCEEIGYYCFGYRKAAYKQSIQLPDSITDLVEGAFFGLNLAELHIPAKITNLPSALFSYADRVYIHKDVVSADPWIYDLYGGTTIYGYRGTFAETFAATYNLDFVALDAAD